MQMSRFLYITRNWKQDESKMSRMIEYLNTSKTDGDDGTGNSISSSASPRRLGSSTKHNYQLVLFPEGTNLTEKTRAKSNAFAKDHNLKAYKHVLHPRTTGFGFLAEKMREGTFLHF